MPQTRLNLSDEIVLDGRRALWLPKARVLAVADLHLGYAWAQRHSGFLFPVSAPDDTLPRLRELHKIYNPRSIVLLGDIVHRAVPVEALQTALKELCAEFCSPTELIFVRGNHDRDLQVLLEHCRLPISSVTQFSVENYVFLHGDMPASEAQELLASTQKSSRTIIMGHEHPAISLGSGPATYAKCPCFLISPELVILPAFSQFAAGVEITTHPYMSALANAVNFTEAVAILGNKLARFGLP